MKASFLLFDTSKPQSFRLSDPHCNHRMQYSAYRYSIQRGRSSSLACDFTECLPPGCITRTSSESREIVERGREAILTSRDWLGRGYSLRVSSSRTDTVSRHSNVKKRKINKVGVVQVLAFFFLEHQSTVKVVGSSVRRWAVSPIVLGIGTSFDAGSADCLMGNLRQSYMMAGHTLLPNGAIPCTSPYKIPFVRRTHGNKQQRMMDFVGGSIG